MILPPSIPLYGDPSFRGDCPKEEQEQIGFFNRIRREYPECYGAIAIHPRNEGLKEGGQFSSVIKHKAEGMTKGAADVIIPGRRTFVCEIKRVDHTKSQWQDGQKEYLEAAIRCGAFACVALGAVAAWEAFEEWKMIAEKET